MRPATPVVSPKPAPRPGPPYAVGAAAILLSSVLFSVMAVLIRLVQGVDFFTTAFYRFAVGTAVLGTLALFRLLRLEFSNSRLLFLRGLFGGIAVVAFYMSIAKLGLARGTVISYTYPLFASIGGAVFLRDRVSAAVWPLVALALLGLSLLVTPEGGGVRLDLWTALSLGGAVSAGLAIVCLKKATATDSASAIFLAQCLVGFWLVAAPAARGLGSVSAGSGLAAGLLLVAIGLTATAAQLVMTWGFGSVSVTSGSLLGLLTPLFNVIAAMLAFGERMDAREVIGSSLVLLSCAGVVLLEGRRASLAEP